MFRIASDSPLCLWNALSVVVQHWHFQNFFFWIPTLLSASFQHRVSPAVMPRSFSPSAPVILVSPCFTLRWNPVIYSRPVSKRSWCAPFIQWHEAASPRWSRRRNTRPSVCFLAVSTDRRPRSLQVVGWGHAAGLAASRCPLSAGWGLVKGTSSSREWWGLARPGWAARRATKTSCGFIMKRSCRGPTPVRWTLTECLTCACMEMDVFPGWADSLNHVALSPALWWWMGTSVCSLYSGDLGWPQCSGECVRTAFSCRQETLEF